VSWRRGSSAIAACSPAVKPLRAAPSPSHTNPEWAPLPRRRRSPIVA
jgi:hypothetical protein